MTTTWTDEGGCSTCQHCAMEMDCDPYCVHPTVLADGHGFGLFLNSAIKRYCGDDLKLREPRKTR